MARPRTRTRSHHGVKTVVLVHGGLSGPWGVDALGGTISEPAWRNKPSWYLLTTEDRMIPPEAQQMMSGRAGATVEEVAASHSVYLSQPAAVAAIIEKAASAT